MSATLSAPPAPAPVEAPPSPPRNVSRAVWRFRVGAVCLLLTCLCFLQDPGRTAADTKLDLAANPWGFLGRALHLWDDQGFFGQLQNQAYGYLWPMGPFFGLLHSAGVAPWVAQRLWWSLLLCLAFLGMLRLVRLLGVSGEWPRLAAGVAFAVSPRLMTTMGPISAEAWAMALAPWVLIPLVRGSQVGSARRWAALSGVAFLCIGGVNAVATAAVLPLGALWLLTRTPGPRRRALMWWWVVAIGLASLWWVIPLLTLGRYSPPFLDWIESAAVTTSQADPTSALRGTTDWVAYLAGPTGPLWKAGWSLLADPWLVVATGGVAAAGAAGLCLNRTRERAFLVVTLAVGLTLVTLGHVGTPVGWGSATLRELMDTGLAPLRNSHKFAPLIAVPLVVGLGWLVQAMTDRWREGIPGSGRRFGIIVGCCALVFAIVGSAWPLVTGELTRGRSYVEIPQYWREAALWLDVNAGDGRALVVPGASFGDYVWGRTQDEPLQPLLTSARWAVRDAVPLSSAGNIRFLDEVESRLESGNGSVGLSSALLRSGVQWLVVRNDLDPTATGRPPLSVVHRAIDDSGATRVASFGPLITPFTSTGVVSDDAIEGVYPAVEIYRLGPSDQVGLRASVVPSSEVRGFTGGPEAVVGLADAGLIPPDPGGVPLVLGTDAAALASPPPQILTDSYRRAEASFGQMRDQYSASMTSSTPWTQNRAVHDYIVGPRDQPQPVVTFGGIDGVSASSSGADPNSFGPHLPGEGPWAALDGDPQTAWVSSARTPVGQWWEVSFPTARVVTTVSASVVGTYLGGEQPVVMRIDTDGGSRDVTVNGSNRLDVKGLDSTPTRHLRLTVVKAPEGAADVGLAEVSIPGPLASRTVSVPRGGADGGIVLQSRRGERSACIPLQGRITCSDLLQRSGEEHAGIDRTIDLSSAGRFELQLRVRPRPGPELDSLIRAFDGSTVIAASSVVLPNPAVRAEAALDFNRSTSWVASALDTRPSLEVTLPRKTRVTGLTVFLAPEAAASRPYKVAVTINGKTREVFLDAQGRAAITPVVTNKLKLTFLVSVPLRSLRTDVRTSQALPVGVTELGIQASGAVPPAGLSARASVQSRCGFGPEVTIDGRAVQTSVTAPVGDVVAERVVSATPCGGAVSLSAGRHRIVAPASAEWVVDQVGLRPADAPAAQPSRAVALTGNVESSPVALSESAEQRVLSTTFNFNPGWQASLGGVPLVPVRLDGWRQGFVVPPKVGGLLVTDFGPDRSYRSGLLVGLIAALLLLVLAAMPGAASGDALRDRRWRWPVMVAAVAASLMIAGPWGCAASLVALVVGSRLGMRSRAALAAAAVMVGVAVSAVYPWPGRSEVVTGAVLMGLMPTVVLGLLAAYAIGKADTDD